MQNQPDERHFLLDLIHGVALFDGTRADLEKRRERILAGIIVVSEATDPAKCLLIIPTSAFDVHAVAYMDSTRMIPKRVIMQMEKQCGIRVADFPRHSLSYP